MGADGVPELAGTARLALRVGLDGLDGRATGALDVAVGRGVGELVVSSIMVGAVADVLLSSVLGELRSLRRRSLSRHDAGSQSFQREDDEGKGEVSLASGVEAAALHERVD